MIKTLLTAFLLISTFSVFSDNGKDQLWQWNTTVKLTDNAGKNYTVSPYLWIPPVCSQIHAVIIASTAVIEQLIVENPSIRSLCSNYGIAIVWSDTQFYHDEQTGLKQIQDILEHFAKLSGYDELKTVPWIPIGHSATLKMIRDMAKLKTDKLAFMIMNKNNNGFGFSPSVPTLITYGEFVEWDSYNVDLKANVLKDKAYPNLIKARESNLLVSYYFDPNTGHFDCSKSLMSCIVSWMAAICKLRFNARGELNAVSPEQGWVCQPPVPGFKGFMPKKFVDATNQERMNAWFPSFETALAAFNRANVSMTRKPQLAGFADKDGNYEEGWWRAIMYNIPYIQNADGTLTIHAIPYFKMPQGNYANKYTDDKSSPDYGKLYSFINKSDVFSNSGNPLNVEVMSGNVRKIDNHSYEYIPRFQSPSYLIVREEGDSIYRTSVQPGRLIFKEIATGSQNVITFPPIPNQHLKHLSPVQLKATSSSGLKLKYFVQYGAAHIDRQQRLIVEAENIPPRTKFPYSVSVVAYQLGSETPAVKTARSVSCTFSISK